MRPDFFADFASFAPVPLPESFFDLDGVFLSLAFAMFIS
jgi:hypothetical protein